MVRIEQYQQHYAEQVAQLSVKPEQSEFTIDNVAQVITRLQAHEHPHLIMFDEQVVGFFILDTDYGQHYDFCPPQSIGIRSLLIDQRFQGQGIAKKALLSLPSYLSLNYLSTSYSEKVSAYLTVNCRNTAAYQCYLKSGFEDTQNLYHGGPVGPQHILQLALNGA